MRGNMGFWQAFCYTLSMELKFSDLREKSIYSQSGVLGTLKAVFLINADGKIAGIENAKGEFFPAENILLYQDKIILSHGKKTPKIGTNWLNFQVETKSGKKLGYLRDFFIDEQFIQITRLVVAKTIFGFDFAKRILPLERIFEVKNGLIIITDDTEKTLEINLLPAPLPS